MVSEILNILTFIAIFQSIILIANLNSKKNNDFSKQILILLFLSFCIFLSGNLVVFYCTSKLRYIIYILINLIIFVPAPLLYFYFFTKLNNKKRWQLIDAVHLMPYITIFVTVFIIYNSSYRKVVYSQNYGLTIVLLLFIQNLYYIISIQKKIKQKDFRKIFNTENKTNLSVLINIANDEIKKVQKLLILFFLLMILNTCSIIVCRVFSLVYICSIATGIFFIISFIVINNIIFFGLSKSSVFNMKQKYETSNINYKLKNEYLKKIEYAISNEKIYRDPLLTIEKLSKSLKIPRNYLSLIINEKFELNFNHLINHYRIIEAKELIKGKKEDVQIIDIAYMVGFNSKSTFNNAFKRYTGLTPTEFYTNRLN